MHNGRPVLAATVGPRRGPDRRPARPPRRGARPARAVHAARRRRPPLRPRRLRHEGRPGGDDVRRPRPGAARSACASTSSASPTRSPRSSSSARSDYLVEQRLRRRLRDHRRAHRPAHRRPGQGRARAAHRGDRPAAHGSTPWLGDNAVLKAIDVFRQIESLPFARESSDLFDRPSINLGRIVGGDALNKVPDPCAIDVDIRYLPGQDPDEILRARSARCRTRSGQGLPPPAGRWSSATTLRAGARRGDRASGAAEGEQISVGRDGASDAICFLDAGVPAVEFGPVGDGHHGPEEWVSIRSLGRVSAGAGGVREPAPGPAGTGRAPAGIA